jgi:four helix bundle protein
MNSFEELEAWKQARIIRNEIAILVKQFPTEEKYKLTDQLLRSTRSVTANIAEGFGRFHYQENIQFCRQARGSLTETLDHLICASDCLYIEDRALNNYRLKISNNIKVLNGYISYLKKKKEELI